MAETRFKHVLAPLVAGVSLAAGCAHSKPGASSPAANPPCISPIDAQIEASVRSGGDIAPQRTGVFDITMPADDEQYQALNKLAIVAITVFSRSKDDLPVSRVEILQQEKSRINVLPSIFPLSPVHRVPDDSPSARKIGRYRQDLYVLVPVRLLRESGTLAVKLRNPMQGLSLGNFPLQFPDRLRFIAEDKDPGEDPNRLPDPKLVIGLLQRQYCLMR